MSLPLSTDILIIGGGAAGFFAALSAAEARPGLRILILERGAEVLGKVKISGGGRCNLAPACFDPRELIKHYPRGSKELLGPFHKFGPADTVQWFEARGVAVKTEPDGRMFPVTDDSQTVIDCLTREAARLGVRVRTQAPATAIARPEPGEGAWRVQAGGEWLTARALLVAAGSSPRVWDMLARLGLEIAPPVPSLFTFRLPDHPLKDLAGLAVQDARVAVKARGLGARGPVLVTHEGLSGPAVLRLSAWGARELHADDYQFTAEVNWLGDRRLEAGAARKALAKKRVSNGPPGLLPARLWERLTSLAGIPPERRWADLRQEELLALERLCAAMPVAVAGKSANKEEFVTAGGVARQEIDFRHFQCKRLPGLFLAGEAIDIDALTGGYNFQAAWTGGWLAGKSMAISELCGSFS